MARDISFGRQGRCGDRSYEAQLSQASALSLVINASEPSVDLDKAFIEPEMSIIAPSAERRFRGPGSVSSGVCLTT